MSYKKHLAKQRIKKLLLHYFGIAIEDLDSDSNVEIEGIVDDIEELIREVVKEVIQEEVKQ